MGVFISKGKNRVRSGKLRVKMGQIRSNRVRLGQNGSRQKIPIPGISFFHFPIPFRPRSDCLKYIPYDQDPCYNQIVVQVKDNCLSNLLYGRRLSSRSACCGTMIRVQVPSSGLYGCSSEDQSGDMLSHVHGFESRRPFIFQ